jgi:hypothetical protein
MTETEWFNCMEPRVMLRYLRQRRGSDLGDFVSFSSYIERYALSGKYRGFLLDCCHHAIQEPRSRLCEQLLAWGESHATQPPTSEQLRAMRNQYGSRCRAASARALFNGLTNPLASALGELRRYAGARGGTAVQDPVEKWAARKAAMTEEAHAQCMLLRCTVGNPFRTPVSATFPASVHGLAQAIASGDQALFPVLADAFEDMGEMEAAAHCRQPLHGRACHIVAWVLGTK